jgi:glycosyltransferase involved in cell wall biosynthesis
MKVAFVSSLYAPNELGGAERTVRTLAEALVQRGHEAVVVSLAPDGVARESELNGVRTHYVPLANIHWPFGRQTPLPAWRRLLWLMVDAYNPLMGARVGRILDREKPDVVQAGNLLGFSAAVWLGAKKRGFPVVQMLHDYYLACVNSSMFRHGRNCERQCGSCRAIATPRRLLSDTPTAVISLSRRTLDKLEACDLFPNVAHKAVVHGACNLEVHDIAQRAARGEVALTVGYLGRVEATKGIEVLLDAAQRLQAGRVRVLVGGTGAADYLDALRKRYASSNIEFVGFVKPADLFARIDVLVVPSLWEEPLGRVIYEAYTHGVPAIVSRAGGMPEIVDEGRTGYVFEAGNAASLAQVLDRAAGEWNAERFAHACVEKSREFDIDRQFDRYMAVWAQAAGQGHGPTLAAATADLPRGA